MCSNWEGGGFNNPILGVRKFMLEIPWFLMTEYEEVCSKKVKSYHSIKVFLDFLLRKIIATIIDDLLSMESSTVAYAAGSFVLP